ncbi:MAG: tRNA (adenosine(37)-N6)-threonylcarbamoyltransferase complex dimerization subunit type 1 TsaB, partial [Betaproteobacteria bacterium]
DKVQLPDGSTWVGCGSGFSVYREELRMRFGAHLSSIMASVAHPSAEAVLTIAMRKFLDGEIVSPEDALPIYVRDKVAKTLDEQAASKRV